MASLFEFKKCIFFRNESLLLLLFQHDAVGKKTAERELSSRPALCAFGVAASAAAAHFAFCGVIGRAPPAICIHV